MRRSDSRILTTHVGSLSRPDDLIAMDQARRGGQPYDEEARLARLRGGVAEIVREQVELGVDVVNDGELGKAMRGRIDYGAWLLYGYERLTGWELVETDAAEQQQTPVATLVERGTQRRDRAAFADFYRDEIDRLAAPSPTSQTRFTGPVTYVGQQALQRDLTNLQTALQGAGAQEAFMTAVAPGSFGRGQNRYYPNEEAFLFALGAAMSHEYKAIVDAGFVLQIDDPGLPDSWDAAAPSVSVEEYRKYAAVCVEALNHGLAGIPEDRVRYHFCWGSWHGPHTTDLPLRDIVDLVLRVRAGAYSVEAGNVRHEHEWKVWQDVKLPAGRILIPGVVSHATNVVEHPELVADRIVRFAQVVGRENVIAGTDCGLGGRIHPSLVWAKLGALAEGAQLASKQLWA